MAQPQENHASTNSTAADRLWKNFAEMFGTAWFDKFGTKANESWVSAVKDLRPEQIRLALTKVRNASPPYPSWLPTLPEFMALARNAAPLRPASASMQLDDFTAFANRRLYEYLRLCGGVDEAMLPRLVAEKNRLAKQFLEVDSEERVDEKEFRTALQKGWNRITAAA